MKNYTRIERPAGRIKTFSLIDNAGDPVQAFDLFVNGLIQEGLAASTVENYASHVASFLDYLTEAKVFGFPCSQLEMTDAIKGYLPARMAGQNARGEFDIVSRRMLGQKKLTKASARNHAAAINKFLLESEYYALHVQQIEAYEEGASAKTPKQIFEVSERHRSRSELKRIYQSSVLINAINHHPTRTKNKYLKVRGHDQSSSREKDFPAEYLLSLLDHATCARDEALWALQAGTGVRPHEAILLEWDHIDRDRRNIVVEDPHNRRFASQMPDEFFAKWKGRAFSDTYFIPILRDRFFEALERYIRTEYMPRSNDPLVFQSIKGDQKPYYEVSDKSRIQSFQRACRRLQKSVAGMNAKISDFTPHSLRHFYGTFMLNYVPVGKNNYGLKPVEVQRLMGHAQLSQTMKYARQDKLALEAKLLLMNTYAMNQPAEVDQLVQWMADKYSERADLLNQVLAARQIRND